MLKTYGRALRHDPKALTDRAAVHLDQRGQSAIRQSGCRHAADLSRFGAARFRGLKGVGTGTVAALDEFLADCFGIGLSG